MERSSGQYEPTRLSETDQSEVWISLKDLPPYDYWVGSYYRGVYWNRLELNLTRAESVCRFLHLPPVSFRSAS